MARTEPGGQLFDTLYQNIIRNRQLVAENAGPGIVTAISGSEADRAYWETRLTATRRELFRADGATRIVSTVEATPKGNFLGTLLAWDTLHRSTSVPRDDVILANMMFGQGTRLSPFTQALSNCKPRFPTPYRAPAIDSYLTIGELAALYSNLWLDHLRRHGFRGELVKWGDETVIPGVRWPPSGADFADVDAVRFVWATSPTPDLAREKDWVLWDADTRQMRFQLPRQPRDSLLQQAERWSRGARTQVGVNLGSLAVSYDLLDLARSRFAAELRDPAVALDWDPFVWIALVCSDRAEWDQAIADNLAVGAPGLATFDQRHPWFFDRVLALKDELRQRTGRPLHVKVLDFGAPLWTDLGQHLALRENLELLVEDSPPGALARELFALPLARGPQGNTLLNAQVHPGARITNSLIVDSVLEGAESVVDRAVIVGSRLGTATIKEGGAVLHCVAAHVVLEGPHAVAFRSHATDLRLPAGGRHTTLATAEGIYHLRTHEGVTVYSGDTFTLPLGDNSISFGRAGQLMEQVPPHEFRLRPAP